MEKKDKLIILGTTVAAAVAGLGGLAFYLGYFDEAPEEADVAVIAEAVENQVSPDEAAAPVVVDSLDGTWTVTPIEEQTFIGYRINEVLSTIGDFEVVGRTAGVTGSLQGSGTTITAVDVVADMTSITTDNGARDNAMRTQALQTGDFPTATFVLAEPIDLGSIPSEGTPVSVVAVGDLTIHGVTQRVEFPLDAQVVSGSIVVAGQLVVNLVDYDISAPTAPIVASVADIATLELSLVFSR